MMSRCWILILMALPLFAGANERFYAYAEALWMHACPAGAIVSVEATKEVEPMGAKLDFLLSKYDSETRFRGQPEKWYWGYLVGVGYRPRCWGCCHFALEWTQFRPCTRSARDSNDDRRVVPYSGLDLLDRLVLSGDDLDTTFRILRADHVVGRWSLNWNTLDFSLGRAVCLGDWVHFLAHADVRYAYIRQRHQIDANGQVCIVDPETLENDGDLATFAHHERILQKFQGIGPRVGCQTEWQLGCCWGFFGNVAASLLYGDVDDSDRATAARSDTLACNDTGPCDFKDAFLHKTHCTRALTDVQLGIFWRQNGYRLYSLTVKLGWEHHYLFNTGILNHRPSSKNPLAISQRVSLTNQDLSLQGLNIFVGIDF